MALELSPKLCSSRLHDYANTEIRSWNPFRLFRKRKLKNHGIASELATLLQQPSLSDENILKIARSIDSFEDSELQDNLLELLDKIVSDHQSFFVAKSHNKKQMSAILRGLLERTYYPWWTLFLIPIPYYSAAFQFKALCLLGKIERLFTSKRGEIKQELINDYSNIEVANQIISTYYPKDGSSEAEQNELGILVDISLNQTVDCQTKELLKEIKRSILTNLPFGNILISSVVLSAILTSYLSKPSNQTKSKHQQATELLNIISVVVLKASAAQITESLLPGVSDVADAAVSVIASKSAKSPLETDKKIGQAFASVAGGVLGGTIGSIVPAIGTPVGVYVGAVLSKTAVARFYQVLEAWQTAPRSPDSIIPCYTKSLFSFVDNDAKNILEPIYQQYRETERISKELGDAITKWLGIYLNTQKTNENISEVHLELINDEMKQLKNKFNLLKDEHSRNIRSLYKLTPDNPDRKQEYIAAVKLCLEPLHQPILEMLNAYFSPTKTIELKSSSYSVMLEELPAGKTMDLQPKTETNNFDLLRNKLSAPVSVLEDNTPRFLN